MSRTITHLYDSYDEATRAVRMLEDAGVPHADISLVGANSDRRYAGTVADATLAGQATRTTDYDTAAAGDLATPAAVSDGETRGGAGTGAGAGASVGTVLGGGAGLLAGIGALAIPGVGPVVAAGWLVALLTGAGAGAAAGGLLGALGGAGSSPEHAHVYAEGVRRGGTLVSVRVDDADAGRIETLLEGTGRVDVNRRAGEYRDSGWTGFDPDAASLAADPNRPMTTTATTTPTTTTTEAAALDPAQVEADRARTASHV